MQITSGIYEVFLERSGIKIWVRGEPSPEPYIPLLYAPTTERRRAQRGTERSGVSSKNIFRSYSSDRLSSFLINLIFSVLKNERGVRGEFHF